MKQENRVATDFPPMYAHIVIMQEMCKFIYEIQNVICG